MAKDTDHTASPSTTAASARSVRKKPSSARATRSTARPVPSGDTASKLTARGIEGDAVARGVGRTRTVQAETVRRLIDAHRADGSRAALGAELRALLDGASPDERRSLRRMLAAPPPRTDGVDPDTELAPGWR